MNNPVNLTRASNALPSGLPPRPPGSMDSRLAGFQHAVQRLSAEFSENLPRDIFHFPVCPGKRAIAYSSNPQMVGTPGYFFGSYPISHAELELADAFYNNLVSSRSPSDVQRNLQAFLNEAIEMRSRALIMYSLFLGANPNQLDHLGRLPMRLAQQFCDLDLMQERLGAIIANRNQVRPL